MDGGTTRLDTTNTRTYQHSWRPSCPIRPEGRFSFRTIAVSSDAAANPRDTHDPRRNQRYSIVGIHAARMSRAAARSAPSIISVTV